jgi:pimeloyl-ACP methyl ester carboxylesterase
VSHLALLHPLGGDVTWTGTLAVIRAFRPIVRLMPEGLVRRAIRWEITKWYDDPTRGRTSVDLFVRSLGGPGRWRAFMAQLRALTEAEVTQCTRDLRSLAIPCAVLSGDRDPAVPRAAITAVCDALPESTLDIIRDSHHYSPQESPEQVARVIARLLSR